MNRMQKLLDMKIADAYLLTSEINVRYACGFTGDSSQLLVCPGGSFLFTDSRYTLQAQSELTGTEVITTSGGERNARIKDVISGKGLKTLGIEKSSLTLQEFSALDGILKIGAYEDVSQAILEMRSVKSEEEISYIEKAARASERALADLLPLVKPGVSELDIKAELLYRIYRQGMDSAFTPIVAGGPNSALPHASPTPYMLRPGDLLTLDFGCKYNGYCSDMTRTFGIGNVDGERKKIYDIVKRAQEAAADLSAKENSTKKIDAAARDYITVQGFGQYFGHGTGHGVGLQVHEYPSLNPTSDTSMQPGMVFTVEPGIYIEGLGGVRIEDTLVLGRGSINSFSKELILL